MNGRWCWTRARAHNSHDKWWVAQVISR
jgi:hypothetical protein